MARAASVQGETSRSVVSAACAPSVRSSDYASRSTVLRSWARSNESRRGFFGPSAILRADVLREDAARVIRDVFQRGAKTYTLLTPQKLSEARNRGGALGDVAVMMLAEPAAAHRLAEWLLVTARMVTGRTDTRALPTVLLCEADASREKDAARERLQAEPNTESRRRFLNAAIIARAELEKAIDATRRELEAKNDLR